MSRIHTTVAKRFLSYKSAVPRQAPANTTVRKAPAISSFKRAVAKPIASTSKPDSTSTTINMQKVAFTTRSKTFTAPPSSVRTKPMVSTPAASVSASTFENTAPSNTDSVSSFETVDTSNANQSWNEGLLPGEDSGENWASSFSGLGTEPFSKEIAEVLWEKLDPSEIEIKPDGLIYLPEIKYRRVLNRAFGPGGWGLAPRSQTLVSPKMVSREYGLICHGRLVGIARGEQDYFDPNGVPTAMEGCKSNALMRCCKDLGIASELWDPNFIRDFKKKNCDSKYFEKKKRFAWKRKDREWEYPYNS